MATSSASLPDLPNKKGKTNWVEEAGGLPKYIERIAKHLHSEQGMTVGRAIATAVNTVKRWARGGSPTKGGGGSVSAKTKALAAKALSEWESKRARGKVKEHAETPDYAGARRWAQARLMLVEALMDADLKRPNVIQQQMLGQLDEGWVGLEPWRLRRELDVDREYCLLVVEATDDLPLSLEEAAVGVEVGADLILNTGAEGERVAQVQARLNELKHPTPVDGRYGPDTAEKMRGFQEVAGLEPTGQVDEDTVNALRKGEQVIERAEMREAKAKVAEEKRAEKAERREKVAATKDVREAAEDRPDEATLALVFELAEAQAGRLRAAGGAEWARARAREEHVLGLLEARNFNARQWRNRLGRWIDMPDTKGLPIFPEEVTPFLGSPSIGLTHSGQLVAMPDPTVDDGRRTGVARRAQTTSVSLTEPRRRTRSGPPAPSESKTDDGSGRRALSRWGSRLGTASPGVPESSRSVKVGEVHLDTRGGGKPHTVVVLTREGEKPVAARVMRFADEAQAHRYREGMLGGNPAAPGTASPGVEDWLTVYTEEERRAFLDEYQPGVNAPMPRKDALDFKQAHDAQVMRGKTPLRKKLEMDFRKRGGQMDSREFYSKKRRLEALGGYVPVHYGPYR